MKNYDNDDKNREIACGRILTWRTEGMYDVFRHMYGILHIPCSYIYNQFVNNVTSTSLVGILRQMLTAHMSDMHMNVDCCNTNNLIS